MKRFFNWLKAVFNRTMDKVEDPDIMLDQARRDMQGALVSNKERAVQAITQKNRLQMMLDDERKKAAQLESQATMALKQGDRELATQFMREKMNHDATIATLQQSYEQAVATVDQVKIAIKRQEEEVRKKTAEALAMKAQWKQAQIQNSISKALEGLTFENQFEGFGAAQERIREAQSEAAARQEMMGTSLQGRVMSMEDKTRDMEAESELAKLEERLGLRQPVTPVTTDQTVSVSAAPGAVPAPAEAAAQSEAERQIEELERRLKGQ
ncbi:PspA/IM30 family protein [Fimbriimonas ginsengisoli]|uniref:Phage shock protein A n=1 Tax=Fimbriimonas ginsengisoli Gsoil 348 TaxID=661478 RepID=A0A068NXI5_FIMGI|nr:PspA/IM30 family protein [Fimbriimonas ginsengisoli]AIE88136.1 phage shock protein A [Fimbriimonas ginsengisoli Gsoil 348]